jgi:hypothetical protein
MLKRDSEEIQTTNLMETSAGQADGTPLHSQSDPNLRSGAAIFVVILNGKIVPKYMAAFPK